MSESSSVLSENIHKGSNYNFNIILSTLAVVAAIGVFFVVNPDGGVTAAEWIFNFVSRTFASPILWWAVALMFIAGFFIFSKYGSIRLGNTRPDYTTLTYIVMMGFAGFGSGTVHWAFLEWSYYVSSPPFGIEAGSVSAYEMAVPYTLHHWTVMGWAIYAVTAIPVCYFFYQRNCKSLKLSDVALELSPNKTVGRAIAAVTYVLYPIVMTLVLVTVLALGVPVLATAISTVFGIADGFALQAGIIIAIVAILVTSSWLGLKKGMSKISDLGAYALFGLLMYILILGPTSFLMDNTTQSIAIWINSTVKMALFTDAIGGKGFPQDWTVFFWAYWGVYIPLMCIFIAKVSKGRTLREMLVCTLGGGSFGVAVLFSITGGVMMNAELQGIVPVSEMLNSGQGTLAISQVISSLPMPMIALTIFVVTTFLLLITTLDSAAFTLACNSQKSLDKDDNPSRVLKVFWCAVIVIVPLAFMWANASVKSIQSATLLFIVPLVALTSYMLYHTIKAVIHDYGKLSKEEIEEQNKIMEQA